MKKKNNIKEQQYEDLSDIKLILMSIITVLLTILTGITLAFVIIGGR